VIVVEHAGLANYNPEVATATAADRIKSGGYRAAIFSTSAQGRDLAPRVAARLASVSSRMSIVRDRRRLDRRSSSDEHRKVIATARSPKPAVIAMRRT
jgi:electron transfer flavoprotein alpha subunit